MFVVVVNNNKMMLTSHNVMMFNSDNSNSKSLRTTLLAGSRLPSSFALGGEGAERGLYSSLSLYIYVYIYIYEAAAMPLVDSFHTRDLIYQAGRD